LTKSPGRISGTKLNSKIINVGKTNKINNQIPDGASNAKGESQFFQGGGNCRFCVLLKLLEDSICKLVIIY
jgi:hypothetical protein